jgi:aspartate/methionine/tyrosine aminotransferase
VLRSDARDRKAILWSDELLADMAYGKFESCLAMGMPLDRLIVADSISKAFNVSSFQGGYTIIPN